MEGKVGHHHHSGLCTRGAGCGLGFDIQEQLMDIVHNECVSAGPKLQLILPNLCYLDELSFTLGADNIVDSSLLHINLRCLKITVLCIQGTWSLWQLFPYSRMFSFVAMGAKNFLLCLILIQTKRFCFYENLFKGKKNYVQNSHTIRFLSFV